jgi:L-threonylcarbamoyladenylate synthase
VNGGAVPAEGKGLYVAHLEGADVPMPRLPNEYAAALYATLHNLDELGLDWIAVEQPPKSAEWDGIRDRLKRASSV